MSGKIAPAITSAWSFMSTYWKFVSTRSHGNDKMCITCMVFLNRNGNITIYRMSFEVLWRVRECSDNGEEGSTQHPGLICKGQGHIFVSTILQEHIS